MLENRWRETARNHAQELALHDATTGRSWTFSQLEAEADSATAEAMDGIVFPQGRDVRFVLEVLRAWKAGLPCCPLEAGQARPRFPRPGREISLLKLTSGSTGAPRMIALDTAQVAADADQIVATMGLDPGSPNLGVLSMAHSYGFSNLVTPLLLHGIPIVLADSPLPEAVAAAAAPWRNLTLPAVPALWRTWHEAGTIPANLRLALSAGAPLPLPLELALLDQRGLKIHNFLGASECGGIAYDRSDLPRPDATCVGTPMEGVAHSIDEDGCLVVTSPAVATTYWPEPEDRLCGGSFHSSDLVSIDLDGLLRIRGRASEVINVAGRKVLPGTVEQCLLTHPAVRDCLAFGLPDDPGRGEAVGLVYALREAVSESDLRAHLASRVSGWEVPRRWWHRDELGVDARGKRSRTAWRDRLLAGA
jgi:acyl-coenzyme A synthetase/AMP-(fatty) acid ligase